MYISINVQIVLNCDSRDLVKGGTPGAAAPGVFKNLQNEELEFLQIR